jgi:coproporphyrinogen III oxidase-like Fe-S oxidoreductase
MENWLALGPAASATIIGDSPSPAGVQIANNGRGPDGPARRIFARRYTVLPDTEAWLNRPRDAPPPILEERADAETLIKDTFLMGFRCIEGPDPVLFERRFGLTIEAAIPETLARWRARGLVEPDKTALNRNGLLLLNPFLVDVFTELEKLPKKKEPPRPEG